MKKILNWIFAGLLAFGICGTAVTSLIAAETRQSEIAASLITADGVTVVSESDAAKAYTGDERKGLFLSASESGSGIAFTDEFSGTFEADFRIFTELTYNPEEYASSGFHPQYGVNRLTFTFTDKADASNTFRVVFENDSDFRALPQVYVEKDGVKAGIFYRCRMAWNNDGNQEPDGQPGSPYYRYHEYNKANNETKLANNGGVYTYILDSTFGNLAWFNDTLQPESDSVVFGFDANEMRVYVRSRGTNITVWDFSESVNDGKNFGETLTGFNEYTVSATFDEVTDLGAEMLLYAVNGESLGGSALTDEKGPTLKAETPAFVMTGEKVALPLPYIFDMNDKKIAAETADVTVTDPMGTVVYSGKYAAGASFTADAEGVYTVAYTVKDAAEHTANASVTIRAYGSIPGTEFEFVNQPRDCVAGTGNTLRFEMPQVSNALIPVTVVAKIVRDGETDFETAEAGSFSYTFAEAGAYTLTYLVPETEETISVRIDVTDDEPVFVFDGEQAQAVSLNDRVELVPATATIGGVTAPCSSVVEFPDGSKYSNTYFVASQAGIYRVHYYATVNGVQYSTERSFTAEIDTASLFEEVANASVTPGAVSRYADDQFGTMITTTGTGTVRYNHVINFANKTRNDAFIEFYMTPEVWNVMEARKVRFTLTDTQNSNNYITIEVRNNLDMDNMSDVKASSNGQILKGLRGDVIFTQDQWGTMINHSFLKYSGTVTLAYDNETKCIYANNTLVIDLDNPLHFDTAFTGFTDGTATLTIDTVEAVESEVSLMIKSIDGVSLENTVVKDKTGPEIYLDMQDYTSWPTGAVGYPYKLFSASAYDVIDGAKNVYVNVYRKMYGIDVAVPVRDGAFVPDAAGEYVVEYSAKDSSGNVSTVSCPVTVTEEAGSFELSLSVMSAESPVGVAYVFPQITAESDHGNVSVTTQLVAPDNTPIQTAGNSFIPETVGEYVWKVKAVDFIGREKEAEFILDVQPNGDPILGDVDLPGVTVAGEKMILPDFTAKDYTDGTMQDAKKSVIVTFNGEKITLGADRSYTPVMEADDGDFLPMTVTYRAETAQGTTAEKSYTVIVANTKGTIGNTTVSGYKLYNYFYGENFTLFDEEASGSTKPLYYRTETSGATLQYVRPIIAQNATMSFSLRGGADSVTVRLTDSKDSAISVAFRFAKSTASGESTLTILGDDTTYEVGGTFGTTDKEFRFIYDDSTHYLTSTEAVSNANKDIGYVTTMPDGSAFTGFPSGLVYMTLEFGNVSGNADVMISSLGNNQSFSNSTIRDRIGPMFGVNGTYPQQVEMGTELKILSASSSDVLASVTSSVSVTAPDGSVLLEDAAITGEYSVAITQYGYYRVTYTAKDENNNTTNQTFPVYCVSNEPIRIVLDAAMPEKLSLNANWTRSTIPAFHTEGGVFTGEGEIVQKIIIIDPDFVFNSISGTRSNDESDKNEVVYSFTKKGVYTVRLYAYDPDYNTAYVDYSVTVS